MIAVVKGPKHKTKKLIQWYGKEFAEKEEKRKRKRKG